MSCPRLVRRDLSSPIHQLPGRQNAKAAQGEHDQAWEPANNHVSELESGSGAGQQPPE